MSKQQKSLHIDIPVKLNDVKLVFSVSSMVFEGDMPASLVHMQMIKNDAQNWNAKDDVVAVFHTNAGHVTLHDDAYNEDRNITSGNPYKEVLASLMERGVRIELCGATAADHGWGNVDLMPGVKVNTDAMARTTQLIQQGFIEVSE
jgi:intracellular sulfur oxidation DsrE/DsrF family protein